MYRRPELPRPPVEIVFPVELKELWLTALQRPEAEVRLQAANTIAQAHRRGMKDLDIFIGPLVKALDAPEQHSGVRLAAAHALIVLDARQSASSLLRQAEAGSIELREAIEPALARWDYRPARGVWLTRLKAPEMSTRSLVLAIQGLASVREEHATDRLRELARLENVPGPIRLEAARALGAIVADGLDKEAETLAASATEHGKVGRLAAALMLRRHSSPAAIALLQRLARDPEPAVTALAASRLIEIDPKLALPLLDHLLGSPDPEARALGVEVLFHTPSKEHLSLLGERLGDAHPEVRRKARIRLQELAAKKELRGQIQGEGTRVLAGKDWRGLEQATILLAVLDHRPAAPRMAELLTAGRPEVFLTAAWGLRKLAVPETFPHALKYVKDRFAAFGPPGVPGGNAAGEWVDHQLSQLNQLLGQEKYRPAEPILRQFVAKREGIGEARAAAVWALGILHEGNVHVALADELEARLNDVVGIPPEDARVRRMAAITLGRMKAADTLPSLERYSSGRVSTDETGTACGWAIERITGKALLPAQTIRRVQRDWFLTPQP
jgi:HEAT repeat protein